jgi:hypothetical protein
MAAILDQAWLQGKVEKSEPKILFTLQADVLFVLYIPHFTCITPCVLTVQQL